MSFATFLPGAIGQQAGLEPMAFGLIIVIFVVFEPEGINGRWKKAFAFPRDLSLLPKGVVCSAKELSKNGAHAMTSLVVENVVDRVWWRSRS